MQYNSLIISIPWKHIALNSLYLYIVVAVVAVPDSVACIPGSFFGDWFVLSKIKEYSRTKAEPRLSKKTKERGQGENRLHSTPLHEIFETPFAANRANG